MMFYFNKAEVIAEHLMTDVIIADTFQLKTDTISTNGLNDLVFNVDTVGEFLRFQISDNTVRVPNT